MIIGIYTFKFQTLLFLYGLGVAAIKAMRLVARIRYVIARSWCLLRPKANKRNAINRTNGANRRESWQLSFYVRLFVYIRL